MYDNVTFLLNVINSPTLFLIKSLHEANISFNIMAYVFILTL